VTIRGWGVGRFIVAEHGERGIELALSQDGWWVEFWDEGDVTSDQTYRSAEEAVEMAQGWLAERYSP
jgi:hypothetical protein